MTTILRIDASARVTRSLSRQLSDAFVETARRTEPSVKILRRDVGLTPPPAICEDWISAVFTNPDDLTEEQRKLLELSDTLIEEVRQSDVIVIATPMYNYGMPAALKAWFDQVVRINKTFTFDLARGDRPLEPILSDKVVVLLSACGEFGFGPGEINDGAGHLVPHVETVSRYLGMRDFHHIGIEFQEFKDQRHEASKSSALAAVPRLVEQVLGNTHVLQAS